MSAEIRAWISSSNGVADQGLTAAELKRFLENVPDEAVILDGNDEAITGIEATWSVTP